MANIDGVLDVATTISAGFVMTPDHRALIARSLFAKQGPGSWTPPDPHNSVIGDMEQAGWIKLDPERQKGTDIYCWTEPALAYLLRTEQDGRSILQPDETEQR